MKKMIIFSVCFLLVAATLLAQEEYRKPTVLVAGFKYAGNVDDDEGGASVGARHIWERPDISQTYRRAGYHYKGSEAASETVSLHPSVKLRS